jgi:hypothetical protein
MAAIGTAIRAFAHDRGLPAVHPGDDPVTSENVIAVDNAYRQRFGLAIPAR